MARKAQAFAVVLVTTMQLAASDCVTDLMWPSNLMNFMRPSTSVDSPFDLETANAEELLNQFEDTTQSPGDRQQAAYALSRRAAKGELGVDASKVAGVLVKVFEDKGEDDGNFFTRYVAADVLGRLGADEKNLDADASQARLDALTTVLGDKDEGSLWEGVARVLGKIFVGSEAGHPGLDQAVRALGEACKAEDLMVRQAAVISLGQIGPAAAEVAIPALSAMSDADFSPNTPVAEAMKQIRRAK